jgi:CubicO group peptidase (beta-lactamase class C family)
MNDRELNGAGLTQLREAMSGYVARGEVPGMVYALSRGDQLHVQALGSLGANGANGAVQRDTIFRIASMTKPLTALATMMLIEDGKLQLNEPVDRLLPELAERRVLKHVAGPLEDTVPAARPITPRDLLTFCFGLGQMLPEGPLLRTATALMIGMGPPAPDKTPSPAEWLRRLGSLPLAYQPGERWQYNTGSDVLGVLIARASGRSLETFMRERIFEPLGMHDTSFSVPAQKLERFANSYSVQNGELALFDPARGGQWSRAAAFASGGGGLCSTLDDFLAFAQAMLRGGKGLISAASHALMTRDQLTPQQKHGAALVPGYFDSHGWGFGVGVTTRADDPSEPVGTYGWDGGLGTYWRATPTEGITRILLSQRMFSSPQPPPHIRDFGRLAHAAAHA